MIPEAAVEAAALAFIATRSADHYTSPAEYAAAMLEAAATHMLAEAWEAGYLVAKEAIRQLDPINPYRAAQ